MLLRTAPPPMARFSWASFSFWYCRAFAAICPGTTPALQQQATIGLKNTAQRAKRRPQAVVSCAPEASDEPVVLGCVHGIAQRSAVHHVRQLFLPSIA